MLKTVILSSAKKTGGCAVTYRSGRGDLYSTCPNTCALKPAGNSGAEFVDLDYLDALVDAVPDDGAAFTYTHFEPAHWIDRCKPNGTVINFSGDTVSDAIEARNKYGVPATAVVDRKYWNGDKSKREADTLIVRCPAELRPDSITCRNCGGGKPLCARRDRDYVIGFTAHGSGATKAERPNESGGCYAGHGHVAIHWRATSNATAAADDSAQLRSFAKSLPAGTILRHHVAGDIGA